MVVLVAAQCYQQAVSHKLNVLRHEVFVHAYERHRQGFAHKLLLYEHALCNDLAQSLWVQLFLQVPAIHCTFSTHKHVLTRFMPSAPPMSHIKSVLLVKSTSFPYHASEQNISSVSDSFLEAAQQ